MRKSAVSLLLIASLLFAGSAGAAARTLLIGVDAIPYDLVVKLTDPALGERALFKGMRGPVAVIETFPSDSYVAWTGLLRSLGSAKALGYEACYFNRAEAQLRGCFSLVKVPAPWQDVFDWTWDGLLRKGLAYGWPKAYSEHEVQQGLAAFMQSDKQVFKMYVVSTDALGHIFGPDAQAQFLRALDRALQALRQQYPQRPFHTVLVSDHGMAGGKPLKNTWPRIATTLAKAGFHTGNAVERRSDVTVVKYGLVSGFAAYTWSGTEEEVASLLTSVPGVDLCVVQEQNGWKVLSARGEALIARKAAQPEPLWSYRALTGDPLGYAPLVAALRSRDGAARRQWFADSLWFEASKNHFYPDALYRISQAFKLVENPASIVCSNSPGYMFGSLFTEYVSLPTIGALRWTHGALYRDASLGFLMTDVPQWPVSDLVRFDRALVPLARLAKTRTLASTHRPPERQAALSSSGY
jgi:Type I phosphodiesterase / nucleotide pyrophosphatase